MYICSCTPRSELFNKYLLSFIHRQEIIEEERIKILKEHAAVLVGFLPPGVLRESDREHLPMLSATKNLAK